MSTREHLVHRLQEQYSFLRDFLPLVDELQHNGKNERLREVLARQRDGFRTELDTLERALNLLGAQYRMERSALAPALREATQRFRHQHNPAPDQMDIHALLTTLAVAGFVGGCYEGDIELARAIGEQDVAKLLEENLQREHDGATAQRALAASLIQEIGGGEARQVA